MGKTRRIEYTDAIIAFTDLLVVENQTDKAREFILKRT